MREGKEAVYCDKSWLLASAMAAITAKKESYR